MAGSHTSAGRLRRLHVHDPKYAVVSDDSQIEAELCRLTRAEHALVVASGGCTALTLANGFPELRVTAFDFAEAQLAHVEAKRAAVLRGDLAALNVEDASPRGLNQLGEFEGLFRVLSGFVADFLTGREEIARFFDAATTRADRDAILGAWTSSKYWPVAFALALHDDLLNAMFGPAATQHAERGSYPGYFQRAFERGLRREDAARNPFLRHVFLGAYGDAAPAYVRAGTLGPVASSAGTRDLNVELVHGSLVDVPDLARFDVFHLSNVFDWSDDALVASWADAIVRHARPGSAVVIRQLNNRRDVKRFFGDAFAFDDALGERMQREDRSLFYERVLVARRTNARGAR
jgi:S-adenosylmethionine-diacylglycerol 3-amino-3-carboxypropyl transferase